MTNKFKPTILNFGHNDLDQLGCSLCIREKFGNSAEIELYSTNYKNMDEVLGQLEVRLETSHDVKLLMITDVSFSEAKHHLYNIKEICNKKQIPVIFVDHHMYPDNYFDDLDSENFKIYWDVKFSGAYNTFRALKLDINSDRSNKLKHIITIIDAFDLWREESERFRVANDLNNYFLEMGRFNIEDRLFRSFDLPSDFLEVSTRINEEAKNFYNKQKSKNLIFSPHRDYSFGFLDSHFNYCVEHTLRNKKIFIIASSFGVVRFRFLTESRGGFPDNIILKLKNELLEGKIVGHLWSFSDALDTSSFDKVIDKFKQFDSIIRKVLKEEGIE